MNPVKKTKMVPIEYWDCGDPGHSHKLEAYAQSCIKKREWPTKGIRTKEAYDNVLRRHKAGERNCDIAKSLGLSPDRIRQAIATAIRLENRRPKNDT